MAEREAADQEACGGWRWEHVELVDQKALVFHKVSVEGANEHKNRRTNQLAGKHCNLDAAKGVKDDLTCIVLSKHLLELVIRDFVDVSLEQKQSGDDLEQVN